MTDIGHADTLSSMMNAEGLVAAAQSVASRWPGASLVKNSVGNLLIVADGAVVGYLDLFTGEVDVF